MTTPILDFVRSYAESGTARFHMPGHKGTGPLGCESLDITEISGADELFCADGIIAESEKNASELFGSYKTLYSTEGSSLAIRAMLALAISDTPYGERPLILATRNAHKVFIYSAALLDFDIEWLYPKAPSHICSCSVSADEVRNAIANMDRRPVALYVTSPDYLGGMCDIKGLSEVCRQLGILLLVDNAHGAYLNFLDTPMHPMALGADMCCDSAHKTLPVLTGGAYLHIAHSASRYADMAKDKMALFASTSPSYLTLASLDACNAYLDGEYRGALSYAILRIDKIKALARERKIPILDGEPSKLTVCIAKCGYTEKQFRRMLKESCIEAEFIDSDYAVFMLNEKNSESDFSRLEGFILNLPLCEDIKKEAPIFSAPRQKISVREAMLARSESVPVSSSVGRICATPSVSCPPAVPLVISGEVICEATVSGLQALGIERIQVVKE
ncbi:MAG: amino acid decarboxylase [Clostridia bacterium]|nr:amino acid decarboxylase [Clostridia bacterium]